MVSLYFTDLAGRGLKAATINRRLSVIGQLHQEAELEDPTKATLVKNTYRGLVREIGTYQEEAPTRRARPLSSPLPCAASSRSSPPRRGRRRPATGRCSSLGSPAATGSRS
jgi:hypothetical protein